MSDQHDYEPGIDVVVVSYRTPGDLNDFIGSFAEVQWEVPASLHVIDVAPHPAQRLRCIEAMAAIEVPNSITVIPQNVGYARACNQAARQVSTNGQKPRATVAFFNADCRLASGVLDGCHYYLHANPGVGIVGPRQVDTEGRLTHAGIFGTNEQPSFAGRWKKVDRGQYNEIEEAVSVSGSAYFVKRACWDAMSACPGYRSIARGAQGAFLPTQHFYEETYLSFHARAHGWKVMYLGPYLMVHKWHQASPIGGEFARTVLPKSLEYFRRACDQHGIPHE